MKRLLLVPAVLLLAAAEAPSTITIDHPWARPSAGAAKTAAAYVTLTETGAADALVKVSTPVAETAAVHETINESGTMKMRPVEALNLPAGKPVTLAPGGYHVMLMGLRAPLKVGDTFPLTLTFAHAAAQTVTVTVEAVRGAPGGASMDHMNH